MQKKIVYIKPSDSSFIRSDQKILEKHYTVIPFLVNQSAGKAKFFLSLISLSCFLIRKIFRSDMAVCWFGDYHTAIMVFFARLAGKPTAVFAGGQETICYPELGKGVYVKKVRSFLVKYALRNATLIIPNHRSLIYHENFFYNPENPHIDGIKHYVKGIKGTFEIVVNGIDTSRINRIPEIRKEPGLLLTVGITNKLADFYNKGFDLFIESARRCPDLKFVLIGLKKNHFEWTEVNYKVSEIGNLTIIPAYCPADVLNEYFNRAAVYLQVSITEGMPLSLGEAMLCECIPVGSNVNGIPDAIGETGVIVHKRDTDELVRGIRMALTMNTGKKARDFTLQNFSFEKRETRNREIFDRYL